MHAALFRLSAAALLSLAAQAAPTTVSAVNMPAWLERAGQMRPLAPGAVLQAGDVLHTGRAARVLLNLPEGSQIKLGEEAVFRIDQLDVADGRSSPFSAALNVLKGAFRFTTGLLAKGRQREVDVRIATVTAGIRGTDIWGKSDTEKDLVCLLEGRISVQREGEAEQHVLDQPLDFFVAPRDKPSLAVAKVAADKVSQEWAPQTELLNGQGLASSGGKWRLLVAIVANQDEALGWYDKLQSAGYPARIRPISGNRYRVGLEQLHSEGDAKQLGERLQLELGTPLSTVLPMAS